MRVHARAGITVPVPCAAQLGARLEQAYLEAQLAQQVKLIKAAEARADDQRIQRFRWRLPGR